MLRQLLSRMSATGVCSMRSVRMGVIYRYNATQTVARPLARSSPQPRSSAKSTQTQPSPSKPTQPKTRLVSPAAQPPGSNATTVAQAEVQDVPAAEAEPEVNMQLILRNGTIADCIREYRSLLATEKGPSRDVFAFMVSMFARSGRMLEAQAVLSDMTSRAIPVDDAVLLSCLHGYCTAKNHMVAMELLDALRLRKTKLNTAAYDSVLWCVAQQEPKHIAGLWRRMKEDGVEPSAYCYKTAVDAFLRVGDHDGALNALLQLSGKAARKSSLSIFHLALRKFVSIADLPKSLATLSHMRAVGLQPDLEVHELIMHLCCKQGDMPAAEELLSIALKANLQPRERTFALLMKGYNDLNQPMNTWKVFERMRAANVAPTPNTYVMLLKAFQRAGDLGHAERLVREMHTRGLTVDAPHYNVLMRGWLHNGQPKNALRLYQHMRESRIRPDKFTLSALVEAYCRLGDAKRGRSLITEFTSMGVSTDSFVYAVLMRACVDGEDYALLREVYSDARNAGLKLDASQFAVLIEACCRKDNTTVAEQLLQLSRLGKVDQDSSMYAPVIRTWIRKHNIPRALGLFRQMVEQNVAPDFGIVHVLMSNCPAADSVEIFKEAAKFNMWLLPSKEHAYIVDLHNMSRVQATAYTILHMDMLHAQLKEGHQPTSELQLITGHGQSRIARMSVVQDTVRSLMDAIAGKRLEFRVEGRVTIPKSELVEWLQSWPARRARLLKWIDATKALQDRQEESHTTKA